MVNSANEFAEFTSDGAVEVDVEVACDFDFVEQDFTSFESDGDEQFSKHLIELQWWEQLQRRSQARERDASALLCERRSARMPYTSWYANLESEKGSGWGLLVHRGYPAASG